MIGLVLVFGMVLAGTVTVVVLGAGAIDDTQRQVGQERTEKAMTQFDSKVALVALGNTDVQQVSFGQDRRNNYDVEEGAGWLRVTIENQTDGTTKTLLNESLGAVTTENGDTTLAYQGGGVWRTAGGNTSVMVSPPEFHFRGGTLTLPVVNVTGAERLGDRVSISNRETVTKYPNASAGDVNPLSNHRVHLTVKSDYYQAWGSYFEERTDGEVDYDHARNRATLNLVVPIGKKRVDNALSGSASREIALAGDGDDPCTGGAGGDRRYTDSYNSSNGDYCSTRDDSDGNLTYAGNVTLSGSSGVRGTTRSGNVIEISGSGNITGDALHTNGCIGCDASPGGNVGGVIDPIYGIDFPTQIDRVVSRTVQDVADSNDNGAAADVDNATDSLAYASGEAELPAGKYYLTEIEPGSDEDIIFNTTDGDITVAVENYIDLGANGDSNTVSVVGDGDVMVYVNGSATAPGRDDMLYMSQNDAIETGGQNATQFKLYGQRDFNATLKSSGSNRAEFVGILYAPAGPSGSGSLTLDQGNVWGGVLTGDVTLANAASLSYDEALRSEQAISRDAKVVKITYLHVSVSRVHVS